MRLSAPIAARRASPALRPLRGWRSRSSSDSGLCNCRLSWRRRSATYDVGAVRCVPSSPTADVDLWRLSRPAGARQSNRAVRHLSAGRRRLPRRSMRRCDRGHEQIAAVRRAPTPMASGQAGRAVTWWNEDDRSTAPLSGGTRARQHWTQLRDAALEVIGSPAVGAPFAVRWIMSGWQVWRRLDSTWCEYVADARDRDDALSLANAAVRDRLAP